MTVFYKYEAHYDNKHKEKQMYTNPMVSTQDQYLLETPVVSRATLNRDISIKSIKIKKT